MFYKLIFCLREIRKKNSLSANYYFFQLFFFFLVPMHFQEARNNVFQINFLLSGNSEKKNIFCCRQILIFSQLKNLFIFLQFLGHMRTQEARNSIFKIISSFRSRKSIFFFSSKISSNFYYFLGLFTPRKPEIMFFQLIF